MRVAYSASCGQIARNCAGRLAFGDPEARVTAISTDSRDEGDLGLFVPISGGRFDGHDFIEELVRSGRITAFLSSRPELVRVAEGRGIAAILCDDTLHAYGRLASAHRAAMRATVIGITGTNGKTTTKELLAAILAGRGECLRNEKNYNNEVGVPFTLLHLKNSHRFAAIEMGMNHAGEIERLSNIVRPDAALITSVGEGHLEFLGGVEQVAEAKSEIMHGMAAGSTVFLNGDTAGFGFLDAKARGLGLIPVSFGLRDAELCPESYAIGMRELRLRLGGEEYVAPLYGVHNAYNALAAIVASLWLGLSNDEIRDALRTFRNVDMRSQVIEKKFIIINDTYNSNPLSTRAALESVRTVFPGRRSIAVLADMKELGQASDALHRGTGALVAEYGFSLLCAVGEAAREIARGARDAGMNGGSVMHFENRETCTEYLARTLRKGDVVLVKGSRSMKMEEVVDALVRL